MVYCKHKTIGVRNGGPLEVGSVAIP